jgi:NDP-sugar pyrophosphorylase family protein
MSTHLHPVVILAGGLATRLGPITQATPKALVDVNGEPFIVHQLRLLKDRRIENVVLCVGYLGEQILERIGNGHNFGLRVQYSFDGPRLLGTGGAIKKALPMLDSPGFFILYGDAYLECDYADVQSEFEASGKLGLMTVYQNEGRWDASNIEFSDSRILAYDKKKPTSNMRYIDYGIGMFRKEVFETVPSEEPYDLAVLQQNLLSAGQLAAYEVADRFYEIGSLRGLEETRQYLAKKHATKSEK